MRRFSKFFYIFFAFLFSISVFFFVKSSKNEITEEKVLSLGFPVLKINTGNKKQIKSKEKFLSATFELDGTSGKCKIRGHGNSTWKTTLTNKKPYLLKLETEASLCGMDASKKWILMANASDRAMLRNRYAEYLSQNVFNSMRWNPSSEYVNLYINDEYKGLYALTEKIEIEPGRVSFPGEGFIAEIDSHGDRPYSFRSKFYNFNAHIRRPADLEEIKYQEYEKKFTEFEESIFNMDQNTGSSIPEKLNVDSFIDWYLLTEFSKNYDAKFFNSVYMNYDYEADEFFMGPFWDHDIAFGNCEYVDVASPQNLYIANHGFYPNLLKNPDFLRMVKERWNEKKSTLKESISWLKDEGKRINKAAELTDSIYHIIGSMIWPRVPGYSKRKTHQDEIDYLVDWTTKRFEYMDSVYGI